MASLSKRSKGKSHSWQTLKEKDGSYIPLARKGKLAQGREIQKTIQSLCDADTSSGEDSRPSFKPRARNFFMAYASDSSDEGAQVEKSSCKMDLKRKGNSAKTLQEEGSSKLILVPENSTESEDSDKQQSTKGPCDVLNRTNRRRLRRVSCEEKQQKSMDTKQSSNCDDNGNSRAKGSHLDKEFCKLAKDDNSTRNDGVTTSTVSNAKRKQCSKDKESVCTDTEVQSHRQHRRGTDRKRLLSRPLADCRSETQMTKPIETETLTKHDEDRTPISKEQSFHFKARITKILNKFKEICSDFELRMEHVKLKHFRKKLVHQVDAKNMVLKSRNVFHKLRIELGTQEKDLMDFYQLWHNNCILERTNHTHEDSSWSESEISSGKDEFESGSNKLKNTCRQEQSIVSECDSEEIFSGNEQTITCADSARTSEVQSHVSILKDSDNEIDNGTEDKLLSRADELASPILGKSRAKTSAQQRVTVVDRVNSEKVHDEIRPKSSQHPDGRSGGSIKNSKAFFSNCALNEIDKSVEDIFEDSVVEQANATPVQTSMEFKERNDPSKDESDSRNNISDGVATAEKCEAVKDKFSNTETASNPVKELPTRLEETLESEMAERHLDASNIAKEVSSTSTEDSLLDKEEQAKRAMLESDSDLQDDESFTDNQTSCSVNHEPNNSEKSCVQAAKIKSSNAEQQNKGGNKITKNDSVFDEHEAIKKLEISANRALLDSSSGNCESTVSIMRKSLHDKEESDNVNSENVTAKTALLVSSNSDSSSTENDNKTRSTDISPKTGNCSLPSKAQKDYHKKDCSKRTHDTDSDTSVGVRVKKRRLKLNSTCFENDEKLQMSCYVVIERLDGEILKKPARAWQKPRLHSDYKEFESLINLENLNRNSKKNPNDLSRNSSKNSSKKKGKAIKETEESLLDHLKKVENGEHVESIEEDSNHDDDDPVTKIHSTVQTNDDLLLEADRAAKNVLLSSNSDIEEQNTGSKSSDSEGEKMKSKSTENSKKRSQKTERDSSCNDQDKEKEQEKQKWRRNKILTMKLSDTDSDAERKKWNVKQEKLQAKSDGSQRDENSDNEEITVSHKKRRRRKILDSDSDVQLFESSLDSHDTEPLEDDDDFDVKGGKSKKRTRGRESPNTDSSLEEKKTKTKRKRIKKVVNDSDTDSSDEQGTSSQGTPGKKGRKNIRKVMKDKQVTNNTKQAAKEEEERIKRIADRQKLYNEIYEAKLAGEEKVEKLVLDFNPETKEELIVVHEKLVARLKPHQADGIKFMWDACFESVERLKTSPGSGCILAHCMGLGKTLQVIVLTHTILTHEQTGIKTILVVSPLSTVLNWVNEYATWLKDVEDDDIMVYELARYKKNIERKFQLQRWQETGGVLIIGYEMFRNLCGPNKNMRKNMKEEISKCLLDPGPDLIVCDEGHLLKNEGTALSKCMKQIKTLRRIVLTGTPLQNNLTEYHCMVQFVKPNLLGTKREFLNRFVNPITNGQFDDSTESDVKLMKKRAYVLNKMLKGCIQRFDYSVLMPFLPPKQEYVIFVTLSDVQIKMYQHYLDNFARQQRTGSGGLFRDFQALQRIWTHPTVLLLNSEKINERKYSSSDTEGSLEDFIDDDTSSESNSSSNSSSDDSVTAIKDGQVKDTSEAEVIEEQNENAKEDEWWLQYTEPEHFEDIRVSSKLVLLFGILKESEQIGDKVLVFSQSLYSLTLIEKFLKKIDNGTKNGTSSEHICGHSGTWSLGLDYFRLDGQTPAESRQRWCKIFNRATNTRARLFLISTRAGGLGINLTAANRVIIFDASWNPSHDVQSIFRIYRFGQKKPCYVYRFLATGTMEEKIYNRQITKLSLSCRVVDEQQIDRHYSNHNLAELYKFEPNTGNKEATLNLPKDRLLAEIFLKYKSYVETYHEHDSLLENKADEELNEEERKQAWLEYEEEKKGKPAQPYVMMPPFNPNMMVNQFDLPSSSNITIDYGKLQELIRKDYPNVTPQCQKLMVDRAYSDMYHYWEQQAMLNASANRILTQNTAMTQIFTTPQISQTTQVSQIPQTIHKTQNLNKNKSGSMRELVANPFRIRNSTTTVTDIADDDIVEVPTSTRSSVSHILQNSLQSSKKNIQEEE